MPRSGASSALGGVGRPMPGATPGAEATAGRSRFTRGSGFTVPSDDDAGPVPNAVETGVAPALGKSGGGTGGGTRSDGPASAFTSVSEGFSFFSIPAAGGGGSGTR